MRRRPGASATWSGSDLVRHLTAVHRCAAAAPRTAPHHDLPGDEPFEQAAVATDSPDAAAVLRAAAEEGVRPGAALVGAGTAAWWCRRRLHETLVHRLDLADALGLQADTDPRIAANCIAEVLDSVQPRQVRLGRMATPATGVRLTTPSGSWVLGADPAAEVAGPDLVVARLLWRRTSLDDERLTVTGDRATAAGLLAQRLTP